MVSNGARPLREWLPQWVDSLSKGTIAYEEDRLAQRCTPQLKKLCDNTDVKRRLRKLYDALLRNNVTDAEQRTRHFLLSACVRWFGGGIQRSPYVMQKGERKRKLARLAKSAHRLARRIQQETLSGAVYPGTDRLDFLISRLHDPSIVFPSYSKDYGADYQNLDALGNPIPTLLRNLVGSFASALDAQVKEASSRPTQRVTSLNIYIDGTIDYCSIIFRQTDCAFIAMVAREVSGEQVTESTVRKRIKLRRLS